MYKVNRDSLAYRVGAIANRAAEMILQKEREKWRAQASRELQEVHKKHAFDLQEEKQRRMNIKANLRKADLTEIREVDRSLRESSAILADCIPKLEEITEAQYAQMARATKLPPKRMVQKKIDNTPQTPPHREEEVYHGGKTGGKRTGKSPKESTYTSTVQRDQMERCDEHIVSPLHSPC
jgi:hypothetical protein